MKKWFILAYAVAILAILGCEKNGDSPEPSKNNNGDPPDTTIAAKKDTVMLSIEIDSTEIPGYIVTSIGTTLTQDYPGNFLPANYERHLKLGKTRIVFIGDTATHVLGKKLWITPGARGNLPGGTNLNLFFDPEFVTIEKMPKDTTLRFKILPNR